MHTDWPCFGEQTINSLDATIRSEQIRLIYRQGPALVLGATLAAIVIAAFLWRHAPGSGLQVWLALIVVSALLRVIVFVSFSRRNRPAEDSSPWGLLFCAGSLISGTVWGLLPVLTVQALTPVLLLLVTTLFAGMVAVKASAGSIYLPAFYTFAVPMVLPLCVIEFTSGVDYLVLTAVLLVLYVLVTALLAHRGYRQYVELIEARERNVRLSGRLTAEKLIAEKAVVAKNRFIAAASHDLRQPLHALGMFIGSLQNRDSDPERLKIIEDMATSTLALSQLLHSLLDLSRLDAGVLAPEPDSVSLKVLLRQLAKEFTPQATQKGLRFECKAIDVQVWSDPALLERVVRNLLSNAIRYTDQGQVSLRVLPASGPDTGFVVLEVADTGPGIAPEFHASVFAEYRQLDEEVSAHEQGLGLGLFIVRRLCALMDMSLELDSSAEGGTVFRLSLPLSNHALRPPQAGGGDLLDWQQITVLVVDDEYQVREAMCGRLRDWGCEVLSAATAREAVAALAAAECSPDIMLCDYRLRHGESGIDAVLAIREGLDLDLPALLLTGDTSRQCLLDAAEHHLTVVHKPADEQSLRQAMTQCLQSTAGLVVPELPESAQVPPVT